MAIEIKTKSRSRTTSVDTTVAYAQVAPDTFAYRVTETTVTTRSGKSSTKTTTSQGLCRERGLTQLGKGLVPASLAKDRYPALLSDELLAEVKQFGYSALAQRDFKGIERTNFFDHVEAGGSVDNIILFNSGDHTFYRVDGSFMATGEMFTYIGEQMCSRYYDLEKVVGILSARDDITFINATDRAYGKTMPQLVLAEPVITPVPYYNSECGSEIRFAYTPTEEQARRIDEIRNATKGYIGVSTVILNEDFLGIACAKREKELVIDGPEYDDGYDPFEDD